MCNLTFTAGTDMKVVIDFGDGDTDIFDIIGNHFLLICCAFVGPLFLNFIFT